MGFTQNSLSAITIILGILINFGGGLMTDDINCLGYLVFVDSLTVFLVLQFRELMTRMTVSLISCPPLVPASQGDLS